MTTAIAFARAGLKTLARSLDGLDFSDADLGRAIDLVARAALPVICTGVGKSGFIAAKLSATLNSLGVQAIYLDPTNALHGDLGIVSDGAVVLMLSNSGNTLELRTLAPQLQARGCTLIAIVSTAQSPLGRAADCVLAYGALKEIDDGGLAPTTSTVVQLAICDTLAAAASHARGFQPEDFYRNHPAGALGKRFLKVENLMRQGDDLPVVHPDDRVLDAIACMTSRHLGCTCIVDDGGHLLGLVTDGDIRRALGRRVDIYTSQAREIMQADPQVAQPGDLIESLMQQGSLLGRHFAIPIVDDARKLQGILVSIDLM